MATISKVIGHASGKSDRLLRREFWTRRVTLRRAYSESPRERCRYVARLGDVQPYEQSRYAMLVQPSILAGRIVSIILLVGVLTLSGPSAQAANAVTIGGPFALATPDGTTVTDRTYRGKWLLVYFGYTSCPDTCPTTLVDIAMTLKELGPDAADLQPLFITLDPQRDTPEVMGEYVQSFDPRIVGLTGSLDAIDAVVEAYGAYAARHERGPTGRDYRVDHSNAIYLMSPEGDFVRAFDSDWSADRIASVLREIMARHRDRASDGHGIVVR